MPGLFTSFGKTPAAGPWEGKEFELLSLTTEEFDHIRELIHRLAGISLSPTKKDMAYSRLARRLRARRLTSFSEYLRLLESDLHEQEEFINSLTTNMTSFFRESHHFPILARHLAGLKGDRPITIWTCASSSGEEPYSLAITVVEHFNSFNTPVRILATDIDTNVLQRARAGIYPLEQLQMLSKERTKRFFFRGEGERSGFAKVKPELQQMITFRRLNLLSPEWGLQEKFDAIFCRNVMIYFDKATQQHLLERLACYLQPNGLFFAGHSESFHHAADLFRLCGKTVYARRH